MSDKRVQILNLLQDRTARGRVSWEQVHSAKYHAALGNSSVAIEEIQTGAPEPDYKVSLFNSAGDVAESFTDVTLFEELDERYFPLMQKIFVGARRSALGTDKTFDDIISALEDPDDQAT